MEERRQWPRLALAIPVFARGLDRAGNEFLELGTILNVSAGGALFAIYRQLQQGSRVSLEIPAAVPTETIVPARRKFHARIVRTSDEKHLYRYAVRFYSPIG
jgi:hypothetical protein